jgi:prevent-host-death family protein
MTVTTKELRVSPGRVLAQVGTGQEIIVTYRGKNFAKIVPIVDEKLDAELCGMWKDREDTKDVDAYINKIRRG